MLTIAFFGYLFISSSHFAYLYISSHEHDMEKRGKIRKNEETENRRFPRFSLRGRCFYCCLTSFRSASKTAVSFSSLGASLRFHATMNRVVAAVGT